MHTLPTINYENVLGNLTDELASIEHERWARWQRYVHEHSQKEKDGSLVIPAGLVKRWEKQIQTPYSSLSPSERESDREQVQKYLPLIIKTLNDYSGNNK